MKKLMILLVLGALGMFAQDDGSNPDGDGNVSPVPEPASIVMMGAGLAGVAFMGWKRNKKK